MIYAQKIVPIVISDNVGTFKYSFPENAWLLWLVIWPHFFSVANGAHLMLFIGSLTNNVFSPRIMIWYYIL